MMIPILVFAVFALGAFVSAEETCCKITNLNNEKVTYEITNGECPPIPRAAIFSFEIVPLEECEGVPMPPEPPRENQANKIISPGQYRFEQMENKRLRFMHENYSAMCEEGCNLTENQTRIRAYFANGRNAEIKIMPDVAAERALERLRLKNCIEAENCTIELKDVGERNETLPVYELQRERRAKIFGFIGSKMNVKAQVNAENGEIVKVKKPLWAFLASEPQEE